VREYFEACGGHGKSIRIIRHPKNVMIIYRDKGLLKGVVCLDEETSDQRVDRIVFMHRSKPVPGAYCEEMKTLFVDLNRSADELFAGLDKTTAYEIRRARDKDGVHCETLDAANPRILDEFWNFFQEFSSVMNYESPGERGRRWLEQLQEAGYLDLSIVKNKDALPLAYHAYYRVGNRARLLHACSLHKASENTGERAFIGRANRCLFWHDMLRLKEAGFAVYDLGGWYGKTDDKQMLGVNKFKEGFGGEVVPTYNCNLGCTLKGRLALWIKKKFLSS
jgi:hypothetical protein